MVKISLAMERGESLAVVGQLLLAEAETDGQRLQAVLRQLPCGEDGWLAPGPVPVACRRCVRGVKAAPGVRRKGCICHPLDGWMDGWE